MHPHLSPRRSLAALLVLVLGFVGVFDQAGADVADGEVAGFEEPAAEVSDRVFPEVPGVDLRSLGYEGPHLDAVALEALAAPLPDEPVERVVAITGRIEDIPPLLEGLRGAADLLRGEVAGLEPMVANLRASASLAGQRLDDAERRVQDIEQRLQILTRALEAHRAKMAEVAVAAYVSPPDADVLASVLGGVATTSEDLTAGVLFSAKADHDGEVEDELQVGIAVSKERRANATAVAEEAKVRVAQVQAMLSQTAERLEAHREALAAVDAMVTSLDEQVPTLPAELDATIEAAWGAIGDIAGISVVDVPVVDVKGIKVHAAIAPRLHAMLEVAHADGVPLGGWGYRSVEQQISLRRSHCGPSPADVYLKPASACSPPTARPGSSLHERGLAIDFHLAGRSISSHDNPGYQWLAANAPTFGFHNLPSEPWHWSVTGQ